MLQYFFKIELLLFRVAFLRLPYTFKGVSRPSDVACSVLTADQYLNPSIKLKLIDLAIKLD